MANANVLENQLLAGSAVTHLDHMCALDIDSKAPRHRLSGIICTIGPVSRSVEILEQIMETGMNIARMNFSHGSHEYHAATIANVRTAAANMSKKTGMNFPIAVALDTKGPEIRTGLLEGVKPNLCYFCINITNFNFSKHKRISWKFLGSFR